MNNTMRFDSDYSGFLDTYWNKRLDELGILHYVRENRDAAIHKPHGIRVTFATRRAEQGLNPVFADKIKGHSTGKSVYTFIPNFLFSHF